MKKLYPVGATWEAVDKFNQKVTIWLDEVRGTFEVWKWKFTYADGHNAPGDQDWGTSYRNCYDQSAFKLWIKGEPMPRFKRVK